MRNRGSVTGLGVAGYAVAGAVLGAAASILTRRFLSGQVSPVLSSWWPGTIITAAVLAVLGWRVGARWELAVYAVVAALGVPLAVIDWVEQRLPRVLVRLALAEAAGGFGLLCVARHDVGPGLRAVLASLVLGCAFLVMAILVPGGIGAGDVRLAGVVGLVAGWSGWPVVTGAVAVALLLALVLAVPGVRRGTQDGDGPVGVPFGPCLLVGVLAAVAAAGG